MGKKSSARTPSHTQPPPAPPPGQAKGPSPLVLGAVIVAVVGIIALAFWRPNSAGQTIAASSASPATAAPTSTGEQAAATAPASAGPAADAKAIARAEAAARLGPHKQATLPPVPFQVGYAPPRSRRS